jgi:pimeloyl-ACP methyl ester carboxylesterase
MPYCTTSDGIRLYYEAHGAGEPVVLAYGIGGNAGMWAPNLPGLSPHCRLVLWEPRGHARSDAPEDPARVTFAHWTRDLRDVLDHLGLERAVVGGLSLGGGIATRFALAHPERVKALIVVDSSSACGRPLPADALLMRAQSIKVTLEGGMDAMAEFAIASNPNVAGRVKLDPAARDEVFAMYRALQPIGYANALRALLQMDYITEHLPGLTMPTLLVCGDEDPSLPAMRLIHQKVPHASFTLLSPAGHFANRDQPAAFDRAVLAFLGKLPK